MTPAPLRRTLLGLTLLAMTPRVRAQSVLPDEAITILVGFQRTGGLDVVARRLSGELERRLGRRIEVVNRQGNSGAAPGELLKKQPADGTTLALMSSPTFVARLGQRDFPFDPIVDLAPITLVGTWPLGLALSPRLGFTSLAQYAAWIKEGDAARRRIGNIASDRFIEASNRIASRALGVTLESVPYPGAAPMVDDLQDGRLAAGVSGIVGLLEHHRGRRVRLVMVTGPARLAVAQDIPTARELGMPSLETLEWYGFFARAGTPAPLIDEWNRRIGGVLHDPLVADAFAQMGLTVETSTPKELGERVVSHLAAWEARMIEVGLTPIK
jgi:tripartite-type tricarboxylate transporter receptor subunit TctC